VTKTDSYMHNSSHLEKNGCHLEFSNSYFRKFDQKHPLNMSWMFHACIIICTGVMEYYFYLFHYTIFTIVWDKNVVLRALVTSVWPCDKYFLSYIVDDGVMNHLIPNKQCMLLFLSFNSYICLPYPHSSKRFLT